MPKRKVNVRKYERRDGTPVRSYIKEIERKEQILSKKWAEDFFEKRSPRSKTMDRKKDTRIMFATPNRLWADKPNQFDIWGLDGYNPPEVNKLPTQGLPFQVVKFNGKIYAADKKGKFSNPEINLDDLEAKPGKKIIHKKKSGEKLDEKKYDSMNEEKQQKFIEETGKNAIWRGKITKTYKKWLKKEHKKEIIADKLNYVNSNNKLFKIKDYYEKLNLSDEELKDVMFKLYNKVYQNKIKSYTKDFNEFYNQRYYENLERKINVEKNRIKEKNKDPERVRRGKENYYKEDSEFRLMNLMDILNAKGYYGFNIDSLRGTMNELHKSRDLDIINAYIKENLKGEHIGDTFGGTDEDMLEINDEKQFEMYAKDYADYYKQQEQDEYLEFLAAKTAKT